MEKGMRVIGKGIFEGRVINNLAGTVLDTGSAGQRILVGFDKEMGGHNGEGMGRDGHCWWVDKEQLILMSSNIR